MRNACRRRSTATRLVKLSKERAELEPVYLAIGELHRTAEKEREGLTALFGDDPEMGDACHGGS